MNWNKNNKLMHHDWNHPLGFVTTHAPTALWCDWDNLPPRIIIHIPIKKSRYKTKPNKYTWIGKKNPHYLDLLTLISSPTEQIHEFSDNDDKWRTGETSPHPKICQTNCKQNRPREPFQTQAAQARLLGTKCSTEIHQL